MSEIAIRVEGLGKEYRIGAPQERYRTAGEAAARFLRRPFDAARARLRGEGGASRPTVWSLRDVSFEIRRGEVVGIVGQNGAGKSTLLKVLSRITEPTTGYAELHGQIASLLEVGTGFHPELTGRENVYLNGSILGMDRAYIDRRFDEIVAFAEIEKFIDTPVKHYSSGMYLRLAFAVAAHLEPEILVVDEVLAVGDAQFQRKCLDKIQEVGRGGRTILFVSHNMAALRNICDRGIALHHGRMVDEGPIDPVVDHYLARLMRREASAEAHETSSFSVAEVAIESETGPVIKTFDPVEIRVRFTPRIDVGDPGLYVGVLTLDNQRVTGLDFKDFATAPPVRAGEEAQLGFRVAELPLLPGAYQLEIYLKDMASRTIEQVPQTFPFEVVESPVYGGRKIDKWYGWFGLHAEARMGAGAPAVL